MRRLFFSPLVMLVACGQSADDPKQSTGGAGASGASTSGGASNQPSGGSGGSSAGVGGSLAGSAGALAGSGGAAGGSVSGSWIIDNTTSISGFVPELIGSPVVENGEQGAALCFDGDDGIVLDANPVEGLAAFTLEVLFRPDAVGAAETALIEPRFVHIESAAGDRATVEARVNDTEFYLDTFLRSGAQSLTLIDNTKVHPVGAWYWAALTYADGQMRHFIEGVEDASGSVTIAAIGPGRISIGVRQNLVYWFRGCVRELRVTPQALPSESLQRVQ